MKSLHCKKIIVAKFKEVKTGCSNFPRRAMAQRGLFSNHDDDI
jgi:hypothetical protein